MLLYLLVCIQKRDSVPGWLPMTKAERQFVVDITLSPEQETVSVKNCTYLEEFQILITLFYAVLYL